jgi:hypothetical protein
MSVSQNKKGRRIEGRFRQGSQVRVEGKAKKTPLVLTVFHTGQSGKQEKTKPGHALCTHPVSGADNYAIRSNFFESLIIA